MKILEYTYKQQHLPEYFNHYYPNAKLLFFDIETTGFVTKNTTLYLIGALWYEDDQIRIRQWFNEDGESEAEILTAFQEFCNDFTHLVHFNGLGFDIPYLKQKACQFNIPFTLESNLEQIDIYKKIRSYKDILLLDNMKQVSIEQYLGIDREDTYSGKELIKVYQRYAAKPEKEAENSLLLHNHDDLLGMPKISKILNITAFFEDIELLSVDMKTEETQLILNFTYPPSASLPKRISITHNGIYLNGLSEKASLHIPILYKNLRHYFADYQNYYYLPKEDIAIHKSVAAFVEAENKKKATKDTCYTKKEDAFLPCPDKLYNEIFKENFTAKELYQTLDSLQNSDSAFQKKYIKNTLRTFL